MEPCEPVIVTMLNIRQANIDDSMDIWKWRNDPTTRAMSLNSEMLPFDAHQAWYQKALESSNRVIYIAEIDNHKVGMVRFDQLNNSDATWEVSINTNPEFRGKGYGKALLGCGLNYFCEHHNTQKIVATVLEGNAASIKIFNSNGFSLVSNQNSVLTFEFENKSFAPTNTNT